MRENSQNRLMTVSKLARRWSWPTDRAVERLIILRHDALHGAEKEEKSTDNHIHINRKSKGLSREIKDPLRSTKQKNVCHKNKKTKNSCASVRGIIKSLQLWSILGCLKISSSSPFYEHEHLLWKYLIQKRKTLLASVIQQWNNTGKFAKFFDMDYYKFGDILSKIMNVSIFPDLQRFVCYPVFGRSLEHYFDNKGNSDSQSSISPMSYEWARLESFKAFPQTVNVSFIQLAKAGFYYTGTDDKVSCYSCGISYSNWSARDDPLEVHRRISPQCAHINGGDDRNHPITYTEDNVTTVLPPQSNEQHNSATSQNVPLSSDDNNLISESSSCTNENRYETPVTSADAVNHRAPAVEPITIQSQCRDPVRSHQSINSNEERQPHTTWLLREFQNQAGNERNASNSQSSLVNSSPQTQMQPFTHPLGINLERPNYPAYSVFSVRTDTFAKWPSDLTQSADDMARAGFLYAGYSDYVRCFFCGGGLRHWEPGDDPWTEHARWFPRCAFLHQNKGEEFVTIVQQQIQMGELTLNESATKRSRNGHPAAANDQRADAELQSPSALSVLEMGYTEDLVKRAITNLRKSTGEKTINASNILDLVFQMEETETELEDTRDNKERNSEDVSALDEETKSMLEENRRLKEQRLCKICLDQDASIAFLPCGHLCCCPECAPAMRKCPICRAFVKGTVKTWLS